jgi:ATP-dependent DNA helicase RecG
MVHPEYRILKPGQHPVISDSLTPIYPTTEGVQQGRLRNLAGQVLEIAKSSPPDELLPDEIRQQYGMPALFDALLYLHQPPPDADLASIDAGRHPCQQRLAFEELLAHYLSLRNLRDIARTAGAPQLREGAKLVARFISGLPYKLTAAQQRVIDEITGDIATPYPMLRLIQGDVGSGKTVVAAVACLKAIASGVQAAVMAPTELLAEQHYRNFSDWFRPLGIEPAWLSGSQRVTRHRNTRAISGGRYIQTTRPPHYR